MTPEETRTRPEGMPMAGAVARALASMVRDSRRLELAEFGEADGEFSGADADAGGSGLALKIGALVLVEKDEGAAGADEVPLGAGDVERENATVPADDLAAAGAGVGIFAAIPGVVAGDLPWLPAPNVRMVTKARKTTPATASCFRRAASQGFRAQGCSSRGDRVSERGGTRRSLKGSEAISKRRLRRSVVDSVGKAMGVVVGSAGRPGAGSSAVDAGCCRSRICSRRGSMRLIFSSIASR